ncbi:MAG: type II toxin-antitoxin system RelB/DinJ family antitoxin [Lachnospiraceae bacterium]|nr:type II toxin-antitoxin system RelB/DinJ family antitoxin [Lachnospiraceae bacterium]
MKTINLRVEDDVKKLAEETCKELGLSMSTAINIFLVKFGKEKRIPFEVSVDPFYSDENINYLKKAVNDIKTGKATLKEHDLIEE